MNNSYDTDWLGSSPVFYNQKTGNISHCINDVIDVSNIELHPEGFNNYLDFGYSVFGQTPVRDVKFLRHSSSISGAEDGKLKITGNEDPVEQWLDYRISEADIIDLIRDRVNKWVDSVDGEIVVPLSGGYDSRLLCWAIKDKSRIRAFSYGLSAKQSDSYEVVYARELCKKLGIRWQQIELGEFHRYIGDWYRLYGVSTHAHGMYHIEFYLKILECVPKGSGLISGIFGDVWAGSTNPACPQSPSELIKLGYTHGLNADSSFSLVGGCDSLARTFWENHKHELNDPRWRVITQIRLKMILISYLLRVPQSLGYNVFSPFLDIDVCMAMLNLPEARRHERKWQREFFAKEHLDIENQIGKPRFDNSLNRFAMRKIKLSPLKSHVLSQYIENEYIDAINRCVMSADMSDLMFMRLTSRMPSGLGLWRVRNRLRQAFNQRHSNVIDAYCVYLTLRPIQELMEHQG